MLKRLKEKWELYLVIVGILGAGYYGRGYIDNIEHSNERMYEKATNHCDYRDSVFYAKWEGTENIEEGRFRASERHRIRTEIALKEMKEDIDRYHWGIRRDLSRVADTQAQAISRDSARRAGLGPVAPIIITR